jgi:hypothetical protein
MQAGHSLDKVFFEGTFNGRAKICWGDLFPDDEDVANAVAEYSSSIGVSTYFGLMGSSVSTYVKHFSSEVIGKMEDLRQKIIEAASVQLTRECERMLTAASSHS